jgi:hypothetical protein
LTGAALAIVAALLTITDWACQAISDQAGPQSREFFHDVAAAFGKLTDNSGPDGASVALFVALLASMFAALGAFAVWIELLIRSAGIYVCVLFFPAVLVARIWPKLERWATRLAEALTALVLSKFVVVATLSLAAGAMAQSRASDGFNGVLAGGALLMFAAFAPLVLFRLVQFAEVQVHARGGTAGTAARGGQTTMSAAQAARIAMDRQSATSMHAGGAAEMARTTTTVLGHGGSGSPSSLAPSATRGRAPAHRGSHSSPTAGATSGSARPLTEQPTRSAGRSAESSTSTAPADRTASTEPRTPTNPASERRPLDDARPSDPRPGGRGGGGS